MEVPELVLGRSGSLLKPELGKVGDEGAVSTPLLEVLEMDFMRLISKAMRLRVAPERRSSSMRGEGGRGLLRVASLIRMGVGQ